MTFIPVSRAKSSSGDYYICTMTYAEVARQVNFAYALGRNLDLNTTGNPDIAARSEEIQRSLLCSTNRILGPLIIAVSGGNPKYIGLRMDDSDELLLGLDRGFGVLKFDGTQQYLVLDTEHRLQAIKDVVKANANIGDEEVCVIIAAHYDTEEGKIRTRELSLL
jgi:DNA sulfur modification protein DndB